MRRAQAPMCIYNDNNDNDIANSSSNDIYYDIQYPISDSYYYVPAACGARRRASPSPPPVLVRPPREEQARDLLFVVYVYVCCMSVLAVCLLLPVHMLRCIFMCSVALVVMFILALKATAPPLRAASGGTQGEPLVYHIPIP